MSSNESKENTENELRGHDRFKFIKHLAKTLQGEILLAHDIKLNKKAVVKRIIKELVKIGLSQDGHRVPEDFIKERNIHTYLSNIPDCDTGFAKCIESWEDEYFYYLAMEHAPTELFVYIQNSHLKGEMFKFANKVSNQNQILTKSQNSNNWQKEVQRMFRELVSCVLFFHSNKVAHLDLSLENTMLDKNKHVKIIDFGVAIKFKENDENFIHYKKVGKKKYMAPEVYAKKSYDCRKGDIWSLGVMLFMMLIGAPPYDFPQKQNPAFYFIINGRLKDILKHWKRLPLVTDDGLDLLNKIFKPAKERINMQQLCNHPFVNLNNYKKQTTKQNNNQILNTNNTNDNQTQIQTQNNSGNSTTTNINNNSQETEQQQQSQQQQSQQQQSQQQQSQQQQSQQPQTQTQKPESTNKPNSSPQEAGEEFTRQTSTSTQDSSNDISSHVY